MIHKLFEVIEDRKSNPLEESYTNRLFSEGQDRILQKIGEESTELIIAANNQGDRRLVEEAADLIYHMFVLLAFRDIPFADVEKELERRHTGKLDD